MRNLGRYSGTYGTYRDFPLVPIDEIDNSVLTFEVRHEALYAVIACLDNLDSRRE